MFVAQVLLGDRKIPSAPWPSISENEKKLKKMLSWDPKTRLFAHQVSLSGEDDTPEILLPWTPALYQEMEFIVTGACAKALSDYKWFTSDMSFLSVSAYGIIQTKRPGIPTVKVVSIFDSQNFHEVIVEVSIPSSMVMLQNFPVETVVGSHLQAAVTMKALNGASFSRCDAFSSFIKWKTGSDSFGIINATSEMLMLNELRSMDSSLPCSRASVYTSSPVCTVLQAITPSIVLHYFDKTQEETDVGVTETYVDVMLLGAPERWDDNVEFTETVKILSEDEEDLSSRVNVHHELDRQANMYRISCQKLGSYKLVFLRGNLVGMDHPVPAVAEAFLSVHCSLPSSVVLIVDEPVNKLDVIRAASQADRAPGRLRVAPVTVANGQIIRVAAVGISDFGEAFSNSSTLSLRWELRNCNNLAYWDDGYNSKMTKSSWERFLALHPNAKIIAEGLAEEEIAGISSASKDNSLCTLQKASEQVEQTLGFNIELKFDDHTAYEREFLVHVLRVVLQKLQFPEEKLRISASICGFLLPSSTATAYSLTNDDHFIDKEKLTTPIKSATDKFQLVHEFLKLSSHYTV